MKILSFDLGTSTGWASFEDDKRLDSGVALLKLKTGEPQARRLIKAGELFSSLVATHQPDVVSYEKVYRWMSSESAFIYNALLGQLLIVCELNDIETTCFSPPTIKKLATGSGKATKDQMIKGVEIFFNHTPKTDDEADAIWLGYCTYKSKA